MRREKKHPRDCAPNILAQPRPMAGELRKRPSCPKLSAYMIQRLCWREPPDEFAKSLRKFVSDGPPEDVADMITEEWPAHLFDDPHRKLVDNTADLTPMCNALSSQLSTIYNKSLLDMVQVMNDAKLAMQAKISELGKPIATHLNATTTGGDDEESDSHAKKKNRPSPTRKEGEEKESSNDNDYEGEDSSQSASGEASSDGSSSSNDESSSAQEENESE